MAHFESNYDNSGVRRTDEHGNPRRPADEHGHPVYTSTDPYGKLGSAPPATGQHGIGAEHGKEHHSLGGMLHRSGSSSSSSSEDDGHGGRRKKGLKEKIKEKLPGRRDDTPSHTTPSGYPAMGEEQHEKPGIMDKIKEKLPGGGHHRH